MMAANQKHFIINKKMSINFYALLNSASKFFKLAEKNNWKNLNYDLDDDIGSFNDNTFVGHENEHYDNERNGWSYDMDKEPERNTFPKSPYQEKVEDLGDNYYKTNLKDKNKLFLLLKSCESKISDFIFDVGFIIGYIHNNNLESNFRTNLKNHSITDRVNTLFDKYKDPRSLRLEITKDSSIESIKRDFEKFKSFYEDLKILYEITSFEETSMSLPSETKWPVTEKKVIVDYLPDKPIGTEFVALKEYLRGIVSDLKAISYRTLSELHVRFEKIEKLGL